MLILVLDVPFLVYLFSVGYMKGDSQDLWPIYHYLDFS